jgi:hypothetical protein
MSKTGQRSSSANIAITLTPTDVLPEPYYTPYIWRFWRPLLGGLLFDFVVILQDFQAQGIEPTIKQLQAALAYGNRHTIVGRMASKSHPGRAGLIEQAVEAGLLVHRKGQGDGRWTKVHHFAVVERFPLLADVQVAALEEVNDLLPRAHADFMAKVRGDTAVMGQLFGVKAVVEGR